MLASWRLNVPEDCCFCSRMEETRDHLLLTCEYSWQVWRLALTRLNHSLQIFRTWVELLSWLKNSSTVAPTLLMKLVVQAAIYHLWKQRNNVLHNKISIPAGIIYKGIDREIRNIILARRHRRKFHDLMYLWLR